MTGLRAGTDMVATVIRIRGGVRLRGANLWILFCAAIIASIGLNTSSAAVIIGAMLISPLMGPILGIGLGIAIHDRVMLLRALRTFGAAVGISLLTSIIYFSITPITLPTPEILARTSPTLLDVGIAFFGGIAGIVAGSRREITTAIPGVAIATALMPPLCTAGYGIATGNWPFFVGAFYLFFLNTVFISLATFLISRLLGIPFVMYVDRAVERRVIRWIAVVVAAALLPSVVIFYDVIAQLQRNGAAQRFVREQLEADGRKALSWNIESNDSSTALRVFLAGDPIPPERIDSLEGTLAAYGLEHGELKLVQLNLPARRRSQIDPQELLNILQNPELQQELTRSLLASSPPSPQQQPDTIPIDAIRREILAAFPTLVDLTHAEQRYPRGDTTATVHIFLVRQNTRSSRGARRDELDRIGAFLRERLPSDSLHVLEVTGTATERQESQ
jgi:uncharacterized hydrophobic protein (TIGR00271 family)